MDSLRTVAYLSGPLAGLAYLTWATSTTMQSSPSGLPDPSTFKWAGAPFAAGELPVMVGGSYLAVIFALQYVVKASGGPPRKGSAWYTAVCRAQAWHNYILCLWSLLMVLGCLVAGYERLHTESSWEWLFCDSENVPVQGALYFVAYVYYVSKFYELFDTVLQVLKSGYVNSPWLHLYHHSVVGVMAWLWLEYRQSLMFIGLAFNTFVHVPMYYYYAQTSLRAALAFNNDGTPVKGGLPPRPTWGSHITLLQIVQFTTSVVCLLVTMVAFVREGHKCSGLQALAFNTIFNVTLLGQFITLFNRKTKDKGTKKSQ